MSLWGICQPGKVFGASVERVLPTLSLGGSRDLRALQPGWCGGSLPYAG